MLTAKDQSKVGSVHSHTQGFSVPQLAHWLQMPTPDTASMTPDSQARPSREERGSGEAYSRVVLTPTQNRVGVEC